MQRYSPELDRIKQMLRHNRRGLSITDISRRIGINRNSVAKYLDVLQMAGEVEVKKVCTAKLYFLSERIPLSEMLSLTSDAILVLNASGVIDFANSRFLAIEEWQMNEIAGKKLSDVSSALVDGEMVAKISSLSPGEIFEKEVAVKGEGGSQIFRTKCIGTVLPDGGSATTLICEDITLKRECQSQLRMKEALYRAVVEDQAEFIIRYSPDRTITFVNDAYCRAFGINRQKVVGAVFAPSIPLEYRKKVIDHLSKLTPDNPVVSFENPVIMPDMNESWHQWTNRAIFSDSGTLIGYQSVGRDITEQVRIQKAKDDILETLTKLSDFSGGLVMLSEENDIFEYVAGNLRNAGPSSLVLLFLFHDGMYQLREVVWGQCWHNQTMANALNDVKGLSFPFPVEIAQVISPPNLQPFSGDCAAAFCDRCGGAVRRLLGEVLQQYGCLSMGVVSGKNLLGTCILVSGKGENVRFFSLIETMINQTAVMIRSRYMFQSMRLAEKRYENLLDESDSMIGIHVGGIIVYANPRLREYLGIQKDLKPDNWSLGSFIHPDDLELVVGRMTHVYSKGEAAPPMKERLLDVHGNIKEVMVFSLPTVYRGKPGCEFNIQPFL